MQPKGWGISTVERMGAMRGSFDSSLLGNLY